MGELKERFISVYNNAVHRDGSDMLLRWLEDSDFFVAPASTKFHGCHEGGLLQHSLNVYDCLKRGAGKRRITKQLSCGNSCCCFAASRHLQGQLLQERLSQCQR